MNWSKIIALATGTSAVITFSFYLITNYQHPIYFTEPNLIIRSLEVYLGIYSIPILIKLMFKEGFKEK